MKRLLCSLVTVAIPVTTRCQTGTILGNTPMRFSWSYIIDITAGYSFTPSDYIQVTSVRSYGGDKVSIWTDSGERLIEQAVSGPSLTWTTTPLAAPITLSPHTTYYLSDHYVANSGIGGSYAPSWPTTFANGTVGQINYFSGYDAFPTIEYLPISGVAGEGPLIDLGYMVVPEPNTMTILVCGLLGLSCYKRWRREARDLGLLRTVPRRLTLGYFQKVLRDA